MESALAWFDPDDDGTLHNGTIYHDGRRNFFMFCRFTKTCIKFYMGLVENYENGYHNIAFRNFFEKI